MGTPKANGSTASTTSSTVGFGSRGSAPTVCAVTNQVGTNLMVSWQVSGGRGKGGRLLFAPAGGSGAPELLSPPEESGASRLSAAPLGSARPAIRPAPPESGLKAVFHRVAAKGKQLTRDAALVIYDIPWYLLLLLAAALFELRRRTRARHKRLAASS